MRVKYAEGMVRWLGVLKGAVFGLQLDKRERRAAAPEAASLWFECAERLRDLFGGKSLREQAMRPK